VSANLLGLVISDSFKTVVTIYILIPFLVIPQIILSGIIVKYEKLNPNISSPSSIPFYGEIIFTRWAYEALSVHQFKNNKYQKQFYIYDEAMSISDYKRNYWLKSLQNKVDLCERNYDNPLRAGDVRLALTLIFNEIEKESHGVGASGIAFKQLNKLTPENINDELIGQLKTYLEQVRLYYVKLYKAANERKDSIITSMQKTETERQQFLTLKHQYFNENLNDFVRNSSEMERIIEYKGRLIQKVDPIYLLPESPFINAHFYAPYKQVFGTFFSTFWVNIAVIWFFSIMLYVVLFYRLLKRFLDFMENKLSNGSE
jgi:uncharacterized membrane protein